MTERSRFWNGTGPGDASEAPYDAPTEFAQVMMALGGQHNLGARSSIMATHENLNQSIPGANTVRIKSGTALVYGTWYENDASIDINIPTPAGATRIDLIVARKSWASQTVRLTRIAGAEGGAAPAVVRIVGTTWDMVICQVSITTGGVMTITDYRQLSARDQIMCEEFTLANGASRRVLLDEASFGGLLFVMLDSAAGGGAVGQYLINASGGNNATLISGVPANTFTDVLGTGSRVNVDWNATEYQIQNNTGTTRLFRVFLLRGPF